MGRISQSFARTASALALGIGLAVGQASVAVVALIAGLGSPGSGPLEIVALNGFFVALFVGSALLFREAAREQLPADAGPEG